MHQLTFEILLNPSVEVEDERRLSRQAREMYLLFVARYRIGLVVSTSDLREIAAQYNARLYEVRRALVARGLCIDLVRKGMGGQNYYAIVALAESTFYKKHKDKF
jgi:hypothetical protein